VVLLSGFPGPSLAQERRLSVLTTVAPLTNIAKNVGGPSIALHGLIPDGTDSHTFEPTPAGAKLLTAADFIVLNGLYPETPTEEQGA
jgi:zinc/manganese transport system substrate-binding protein/manganese/iron transport system substrate-binding protein